MRLTRLAANSVREERSVGRRPLTIAVYLTVVTAGSVCGLVGCARGVTD